MNVYIEYVVLDNFVIDSLLLWAAAATLRVGVRKFRIVLGGAVGSLCAVVSVWLTGLPLYVLKGLCLAAMCFACVGWGKKLLWHVLLTVAYTFAFGGAIVGLFNLFNVDYLAGDGQFYRLRVPLFVYVTAAALCFALCFCIVRYIAQARRAAPFITHAIVTLDKPHKVSAFCDSGNSLSYNGLPVCFVTRRFGNFKEYFAEQTLLRNAVQIDVRTVAGQTQVTAVPAKVCVDGTSRDVYLALPAQKCETTYSIILSNDFCGGEQ